MFNFFRKKVVTRIAPSPTGVMHVGTARTALFNYLYAKKYKGEFVLRIEDTDTERSKKEFEEDILNSMKWLGLEWDHFYRQSERISIYKKYLEKIISEGKAYISKEENNEEGKRSEVIRFKNPNKVITFKDDIRGDITFDTTELGDFVIAKSLTEPLYHFAVVVDDFEMKITHIIRGEDGISNTPRQILIQEAIGAKRPNYAHLPLILAKDKSKMSKRHGASSIKDFVESGYLKEAIINFIAFLGWNPGTEKEIYSIDELIKDFDITKISKSGAVFNEEKLNWYNQNYLKINISSDKDYLEYLKKSKKNTLNEETLLKIKKIVLERISNINDFENLLEEGEFDFISKDLNYDIQKVIWKNESKENTILYLEKIKEKITELKNKDKISYDDIKESVWDFANEKGKGNVLWPYRYTLSGREKSPDPFTLTEILGIDESVKRINYAIQKLQE